MPVGEVGGQRGVIPAVEDQTQAKPFRLPQLADPRREPAAASFVERLVVEAMGRLVALAIEQNAISGALEIAFVDVGASLQLDLEAVFGARQPAGCRRRR